MDNENEKPDTNRNIGPENSPGATIPERIRGGISAILLITAWSIACNTHDSQIQLSGIVAGFFFFLTTLGMVFDKGMVSHHPR